MYTPLYTKQTTRTYCNCTWNYTQYFVIFYKGKESKKEQSYRYRKTNHFAVYLKLTYCKSTTLNFLKSKPI